MINRGGMSFREVDPNAGCMTGIKVLKMPGYVFTTDIIGLQTCIMNSKFSTINSLKVNFGFMMTIMVLKMGFIESKMAIMKAKMAIMDS
jgi:hypothetical protein